MRSAKAAVWKMGEEEPVRLINDVASFKASAKSAPSFTMRAKLPSANDVQNRLPTEPASRGDLKKEILKTRFPEQPSFIFGKREAGLLPPPKQPGPGEYALGSTIEAKHPTEVMTGRGFSWGSTGRSAIGKSHNGPSPIHYRVNSEPALKKQPAWTVAAKRKDPADKEKKPGCQTYKVGNVLKDGPIYNPEWSCAPRRSEISNARSTWPGPGSYYPHIDANGRRDRAPKWALYTNDRFKPLKKDRY